jgi:tetratricopeptide (TPR) repeat protein
VANQVATLLLDSYRDASTLGEAERALRDLERSAPGEVPIGDLYDELAELAAEEGDFGLAVRAQRRALELGCEMPRLGRQMLGWYLMNDGQRAAGEAEFDAVRRDAPADPDVLIALGNARSDAGDEAAALEAFDEALAAAEAHEDRQAVAMARSERRESRQALGFPEDDEDRAAPRPLLDPGRRDDVVVALSWFPRSEHVAAVDRWADLHDDLFDADAYCARIEQDLRELTEVSGRRPSVAPITVRRLCSYAEREGLDPADGATRASLAVELHRLRETISWPPGRNEPCWCGSGRKYKRCCGR